MRSVRLNKELEQKIDSIAKQKEISRSEVIREALNEYVVNHNISTRPYEIGKTWFGARGSGESDRSVTFKSRIKSRLREKHTR